MNRNNQIASAVRTQLSCQLCIGLKHGIQKQMEGLKYE